MAYQKQDWYDLPNQTTPISATRLGHIEDGIYDNSINIGDLANLDTTNKNNLVGAINEINEIKNVKVYVSGTSITFTAPFSGIIDITSVWSGWGYDGGQIELQITNPTGSATNLGYLHSKQNGHNTTSSVMMSKAYYYVEEGVEYSFGSNISGQPGGNLYFSMIGILKKEQSV